MMNRIEYLLPTFSRVLTKYMHPLIMMTPSHFTNVFEIPPDGSQKLHVRAYGSREEKEARTEIAGFCSLDCMRLSHFSPSERSELLFLGI